MMKHTLMDIGIMAWLLWSACLWRCQTCPAMPETYITVVNIERLVQAVFPGSVPLPERGILKEMGVTRYYQSTNGDVIKFSVGIYPNEVRASSSLQSNRMFTTVGPWTLPADEITDEHLYFRNWACLRVKNVAVKFQILGKPVKGTPVMRESEVISIYEEAKRDGPKTRPLLAALSQALRNFDIVTVASDIQYPPVEIGQILRQSDALTDEQEEIVYHFDGPPPLLGKHDISLGDGWYRSPASWRYETTEDQSPKRRFLFIAWPTGLVQYLPVETATTNARLAQKAAALTATPTPTPGVSDAEIQTLMRRLRAREGDIFQQQDLMRPLIQAPTEEMLPFFMEIINSDRETTLKDFALQGLVRLKGASGLELYRTIAQDRRQDETIRQYALLAIGNYGNATDLQFVDELLVKEQSDWLTEVIEAVREQIQNRLSSQ